ncbi:hypothetical protein [Mycobacterium genavense]|nr:hypothetical protein [Mycobacterium genavense]
MNVDSGGYLAIRPEGTLIDSGHITVEAYGGNITDACTMTINPTGTVDI